jgi:hypothetical protein
MKAIEEKLASIIADRRTTRAWLDAASSAIGEVAVLRKSFQRMHRRAQRAEAQALREGKRADALSGKLQRALTGSLRRENC